MLLRHILTTSPFTFEIMIEIQVFWIMICYSYRVLKLYFHNLLKICNVFTQFSGQTGIIYYIIRAQLC